LISLRNAGLLAAAVTTGAALAQAQSDVPPAGFGTLRQDQVAVRLTVDNLAVRALPLDERVIRLLAPDAYRSLKELKDSRGAEIAAASRAAGRDSVVLVLVNFYALQPSVRFSPDQLHVSSQGNFFRPLGVVPLTPRWSEYQLDQRQQAAAIFLFDPAVAVLRPFTVVYGDRQSDAWTNVLRALDGERARVLSRAARSENQP
jgi:hypothetical protein